jgi:hypothetical protein
MRRLNGRIAIVTGGAKYWPALFAGTRGRRRAGDDCRCGRRNGGGGSDPARSRRQFGHEFGTDVSEEPALWKHVVPHMKAPQYGKIINTGSGTAYRGVPMLLHYSSTFARARSTRHPRQHVRARFHLERLQNPEHVRTAQPRAIAGRAMPRDEHPHDLLGALIF